MNGYVIRTLALTEARLRLRRLSTLVVLLAVVAIGWMMIPDPAGGSTLISMGGARVRYTSSALALGSAALASLLFGLAGFYLLRGRMAEDLRSGLGGVIGASPAGNLVFLLGRWCGGVLYLLALAGVFLLTILACHLLRGEGPIEPLVYLQTHALVLVPLALFAAGCAVLFDAWAPLMGKGGDVLYFFVWVAQIGMLANAGEGGGPVAIPLDFSGLSTIVTVLGAYGDVHDTMVGIASFDRTLAPLALPSWTWSAGLAAVRCLAAVLALVPLLPAVLLFHRYSPDRVKPARARARRSPLALANGWLRPLARLAQPLFALAARLPGPAGQAVADVALTLASAPAAIALLLAAQVAALCIDAARLPALALGCVACWGILAGELSTRDRDAACDALGATVPGGAARRYWRQLAAALLLGLLFAGVAALRLALADPLRAVALLAGVFALAALAALLGRASGTARTFLALFLFGLYVSVNAHTVPRLDIVGFHGIATAGSVLQWLAVGIVAAWAGHAWNRHMLRRTTGLLLAAMLCTASAQESMRIFDPSALKGPAKGVPNEVLVLGTAHLKYLPATFQPDSLQALNQRLAAWKPRIIAIERLSGTQCAFMRQYPRRYAGTVETYCWDTAPAHAATGLDVPAATAEAERLLASWPAQPTPAQRRHLAALFMAGGEPVSALVQWLRLPETERRAGDGLDAALAEQLEQQRTRRSEDALIAAPLAAALGLERVLAMDDHTADAPDADPKAAGAAIGKAWDNPATAQRRKADERLHADVGDGDGAGVLALYRAINDPAQARLAYDSDVGAALEEGSPQQFGRGYVGYWETRNLRMASNIRDAIGLQPGGRTLVIVGASHKPYLEAYLHQMHDVRIVSSELVLR